MMQFLERLTVAIAYVTAFALVLLVILVVFDASARYLFSAGSTALQELEWHLFDVVILLSIAYTLRSNAHVRVDILYDKFAPKTQLVIQFVTILFFILPLSGLIVYIGYDFVHLSYVQNEASSDPGGLPYRWIVKALMPLAFVLLILQALKELHITLTKWKNL